MTVYRQALSSLIKVHAREFLKPSMNTPPSRKIRVLIDMDGVIANFEKHLMDIYKKDYPDLPILPGDQRRGLFIDKQYRKEFGHDACLAMQDIMTRQNFFKDLEPIPEAVHAVNQLLKSPLYDCSICTAPITHNKYCTSEKMEWIKTHFGSKFHRKVIITNDKTVVHGDFLLDDNEVIAGAMEPSFKHVMVRAQHNQAVKEGEKEIILEDWNELEEILFEHAPADLIRDDELTFNYAAMVALA